MSDSETVALALVERQGRWLVSRRGEGRPFAGLWEFPGGRVAPGESPTEAAVRETWEETGLTVQAVGTLGRVTSRSGDGRVVLHLVLCRPIAGEAAPVSPAVTQVRWAAMDELRGLAMPPANAEIVERLARRADA
jgi:mutator protein MutT